MRGVRARIRPRRKVGRHRARLTFGRAVGFPCAAVTGCESRGMRPWLAVA